MRSVCSLVLKHGRFKNPLEQRLFHAPYVPGFAARAGNHHSDTHEIMPAALAFVVLCEERFRATGIDSAAADLTHKRTVLDLLSYNPLGAF
jgi:hypothetical protein